ncbi:MAG: hypothetical protein HY099_01215 [Nitrospirae bacterium]|nr:hypothetical protein [Nitrospirota bacterium]
MDSSDIFWKISMYRGFVTYSYNSGDVIIGRQRVAWGTGKFWNPTDLFNPYNPLGVERDERPGVDALKWEQSTGPLSKIAAVYAHRNTKTGEKTALKYRTNLNGYDFSIMTGKFADTDVIGMDFSGSIGDVGIHGEGVYRINGIARHKPSLVLGGEYTFRSSLYLLLEYYYNDEGQKNSYEYDIQRLLAGEIVNLGREYLGVSAGYDFSGILRGDLYSIYNIRDKSIFIQPAIRYSIATDFDWSVGIQIFAGKTNSEFGRLKNIYYTQVQWFF